MLSFFDIIFIQQTNRFNDDGLSKNERNNLFTLSILVLVTDEKILEAAKDTWILDCPFEVMFRTSDNNSMNSLTVNHQIHAHDRYTMTIDVRFYVIIARLQQIILNDKLHVYCSTAKKNRDCSSLPNDIFIGPLETPRDFERIHRRLTNSSRRPIQNPKGYNSSLDPNCVHNPLIQLETYRGFYLRECPSPPLPRTPIALSKLPTYMITIKTADDEEIKSVIETFRLHGLHVRLYHGFHSIIDSKQNTSKLSIGERNLKETMRRLIIQLINTHFNQVLVFEDDVIPHKDFGSLLGDLITTSTPGRCTAHILDGADAGGILLLGATVWSTDRFGWKMIDQDVKNNSFESACFNVDRVTYGAFAVLIHRTTFQSILNWLNDPENAHLPYDHIFYHLSQRGHIVRVVYPFLAISNITHVSSVNPQRGPNHRNITWRSKVHRWFPLKDYKIHHS
ncbi:hypothetical protein I4U23_031338 [Adineta vaga]|nr:hypothetical protein I4U23_031338 [Adineta vaga]